MSQSFSGGRPATFDELRKFFSDMTFPEAKDVQMVGLVREGDIVRDFRVNARTYKSLLFGDMQLAGSGSDHFLEKLPQIEGQVSVPVGQPSSFEGGVARFLLGATFFLGNELNTAGNLPYFYGGGFEIVILEKGTFAKLDDVTYVFWTVNVISSEQLRIAIQLAAKFSYVKDVLLIHRFNFGIDVDDRAALFAVTPVHRNLDKTGIQELKGATFPNLNSHIICHYFSMTPRDITPKDLVMVEVGQRDIVKFTNEGNKMSYMVYKNLGERLLQAIRELRK